MSSAAVLVALVADGACLTTMLVKMMDIEDTLMFTVVIAITTPNISTLTFTSGTIFSGLHRPTACHADFLFHKNGRKVGRT